MSPGAISDTSGMKARVNDGERKALALIRKIQAMSDKYGGHPDRYRLRHPAIRRTAVIPTPWTALYPERYESCRIPEGMPASAIISSVESILRLRIPRNISS